MTTAALQLCRRTTTKVPGAAKDHDSSAKNHQRRYDRVTNFASVSPPYITHHEGRRRANFSFRSWTKKASTPLSGQPVRQLFCQWNTDKQSVRNCMISSPCSLLSPLPSPLSPLPSPLSPLSSLLAQLLISRLDRGRVGKRAEPPLASLGLPGQSACTKWCIIHLLLTTKTRTKPEHKQVTRGPTLLPPYLPPLPPTPPPPPLYPSNYSPLPASPPRTTPYDHLQQHSGQQQQTRKHRRPLLVHSRINVFHTFSASPSVKASERIPDLLKSPFTIKQHLEVLKQEDPPFPPDVDGMMRLL
ncbi:hypothetical protein TcWFU_006948 [Taenia crassiceps]|uniref:Uncharacterized protein n=1 Tax=Taenia crassiceps TaxID=6207 RepID=A0ABR4QBG6_9CEST